MPERDATDSSHARLVLAAGVFGVLAIAVYLAWPWLRILGDPQEAQRMIETAGAWGPVVFIGIQVAQVVIAPIPGQATVLVGGYLFGPALGLLYTLIGSTTGSVIVFALTRKLGRPFVEHFVSPSALARFDALAERRGALAIFFIFLLPALPDDLMSFAAGLTGIPIATLVVISVAGRLPGYLVLNLAGYGLTRSNLIPVATLLALMGLLLAVAYWKREWVRGFAESDDRASMLEDAWRSSWRTVIVVAIVALSAGVILTMAVG